ncbi:DUF2782 domain-containing protein [Candidatus Nitrosacidococcus tergens]|uniref:DUF2782 domain-containing protein n=1 Tax=Candidatus Nitrosacidococcus tergens TaxID=553981 RepID=A0A7G1QAS3_9GAMM|nr:DUF2782 domain-containing protein [Candidatus Nitrosacidococcus tergens]CAB1276869.1 conserved protein of unknown function [Candidatus Nitrosacidococcus tergens]
MRILNYLSILALILGVSFATLGFAVDDIDDIENSLPDLGAPAAPDQAGDSTGPEVKIIQDGNTQVKEYRLNGKLYKVKVTPAVGPSYYLVDINGKGDFEKRFNTGPNLEDTDLVTPSWVFFRF